MQELLDIITTILIFWAGWSLRGLVLMHKLSQRPQYFRRLLDELEKVRNQEDTPDPAAKSIEWVDVEWHQGQAYLWRQRDRKFLGQGPDLDTAIERCQNLEPGIEYRIPKEMAKSPDSIQP